VKRKISLQLTAFFTSATILASAAAVNSLSAKEVGHIAPSSSFASSLAPQCRRGNRSAGLRRNAFEEFPP
jgi:hypothetical protein